jgi:hypothetical protein
MKLYVLFCQWYHNDFPADGSRILVFLIWWVLGTFFAGAGQQIYGIFLLHVTYLRSWHIYATHCILILHRSWTVISPSSINYEREYCTGGDSGIIRTWCSLTILGAKLPGIDECFRHRAANGWQCSQQWTCIWKFWVILMDISYNTSRHNFEMLGTISLLLRFVKG